MLAMAAEQGGQSRRPQQAAPAGLRALAAVAARRAVVGVAVGARPAGVAHRVLGPGPARAGRDHRRPRRRTGPGLPPPRVRDGPVRVGDRPALRPALAPRRPGRAGRHQDVQVARQPGLRGRPVEGVGARRDPAGPARPPLPARLGVDRRGPAPGRSPDWKPGGRRRGRHLRPGRPTTGSRRRPRPGAGPRPPRRRPRHAGGPGRAGRRGRLRPPGGAGAALLGVTL